MAAWGGTLPYTWTVLEGTLPVGLTLGSLSGMIHGTPVRAETQAVLLSVQDASIATQRQEPQRFMQSSSLVIVAPGSPFRGASSFSNKDTMPLDVEDGDDADLQPSARPEEQ